MVCVVFIHVSLAPVECVGLVLPTRRRGPGAGGDTHTVLSRGVAPRGFGRQEGAPPGPGVPRLLPPVRRGRERTPGRVFGVRVPRRGAPSAAPGFLRSGPQSRSPNAPPPVEKARRVPRRLGVGSSLGVLAALGAVTEAGLLLHVSTCSEGPAPHRPAPAGRGPPHGPRDKAQTRWQAGLARRRRPRPALAPAGPTPRIPREPNPHPVPCAPHPLLCPGPHAPPPRPLSTRPIPSSPARPTPRPGPRAPHPRHPPRAAPPISRASHPLPWPLRVPPPALAPARPTPALALRAPYRLTLRAPQPPRGRRPHVGYRGRSLWLRPGPRP